MTISQSAVCTLRISDVRPNVRDSKCVLRKETHGVSRSPDVRRKIEETRDGEFNPRLKINLLKFPAKNAPGYTRDVIGIINTSDGDTIGGYEFEMFRLFELTNQRGRYSLTMFVDDSLIIDRTRHSFQLATVLIRDG